MSLRAVLLSLQQLLVDDVVNAKDPQDSVVGGQLLNDERLFKVKSWIDVQILSYLRRPLDCGANFLPVPPERRTLKCGQKF